jgi:predicted nucleotidyltransferase
MKPSVALKQHRDAIRRIVESHHANNARVFGSVLHGEDTDTSDLDILVDTTEDTSLFDIGAIRVELTELLGVEVDVLTPGSLPDRWKRQVIDEAREV